MIFFSCILIWDSKFGPLHTRIFNRTRFAGRPPLFRVFFIFVFYKKKLQKYIFGFRFCSFVPYRLAGGGRGPTARQVGGRDLYINKYIFFAQRSLAGACRPFPRALIFCPRDPERGEGERRGEGGNSTGEALPDFGSEPQVTNISQLSH